MSAVVLSFFPFSSNTGVPVNPKNSAFGKVFLIVVSISPKVERWHSSRIKTTLLERMVSRSFALILPSASSRILLIFWIEDTIRVSFGSMLVNFPINAIVSSVSCTSSGWSAKARYSFRDWVPNSIRSIKNTTLSAVLACAISCADLKDVIVFPEPVVCQM